MKVLTRAETRQERTRGEAFDAMAKEAWGSQIYVAEMMV